MNVLALQSYFWTESQRKQKFGVIDCVQFVAGAVKQGWDRDYSDVLQYHDRRSAVKRLRELGGLMAACDMAMGKQHMISELEPGDVVWFDVPKTIGLLMPGYIAVKMGCAIHRLEIDPRMFGWKT